MAREKMKSRSEAIMEIGINETFIGDMPVLHGTAATKLVHSIYDSIVNCNECKYFDGGRVCSKFYIETDATGHCSWGEKND